MSSAPRRSRYSISCVILSADDRQRLAAIIGDRSRPLKHVQRARIILHSGDMLPVLEIARRAGVSRPAVWRWQQRYAEEGIDGLLRERPALQARRRYPEKWWRGFSPSPVRSRREK